MTGASPTPAPVAGGQEYAHRHRIDPAPIDRTHADSLRVTAALRSRFNTARLAAMVWEPTPCPKEYR